MKSFSLKQQLQYNLFLTLVLVMGGLLLLFYQGVLQLTQQYVTSRLQHDAEALLGKVEIDPNGNWRLPSQFLPSVYQQVRSGHYFAITTPSGHLRSRSLFDTEIHLPELSAGGSLSYIEVGLGGESWLVWVQQATKQAQPITIWIAEDIAPLQKLQSQFISYAIILVCNALLLLLFIQYRFLQRGFLPLERARLTIAALHLGESDFSLDAFPQEIAPLMEEIKRLLAQLKQRIERSRNALGNTAHELKRPLQHLRSLISESPSTLSGEGEAILSSMEQIIERELKRAKIVGVATPGRYTTLGEDLPYLINMMQRIYPHCTVYSHCPEQWVLPYDRDDIMELLGNLLDNACKHAQLRVELAVNHAPGGWQFTLQDDGSGVSDEEMNFITTRGVRLDESKQGHGFGLSICNDIVNSYCGRLEFSHSPLGGLQIIVGLPLVSAYGEGKKVCRSLKV